MKHNEEPPKYRGQFRGTAFYTHPSIPEGEIHFIPNEITKFREGIVDKILNIGKRIKK